MRRFPLLSNADHVLVISAILLVIAAIFSMGYTQSDEHFQLLEFAGLKLGINQESDLAWEFGERMRPALQPGLVYLLVRGWNALGVENPFFLAFFLRLLSGALFLFSSWYLMRTYREELRTTGANYVYLLFAFLLWFQIYNGVRFNSEHWAGATFMLAFGLFRNRRSGGFRDYVGVGLLMGLSYLFRYQMAFLIVGFVGWLLFMVPVNWRRLLGLAAGGLAMLGLGVLIDYWFYGEWVFSSWNYFAQNILEDKASTFGTDPWYAYLVKTVLKGVPPAGLVYLAIFGGYCYLRPRSPLTWMVIPFVLIHTLISHKEVRFLYPIIGFLPIMAVVSWEWLRERYPERSTSRPARIFWKIFLVTNLVLMGVVLFRAPTSEVPVYRYIYRNFAADTRLYSIKETPYDMALEVNFYKAPGLETLRIDDLGEVVCGKDRTCLLALSRPLEEWPNAPAARLVHDNYPEWLEPFNVNNWMAKSHWWWIYEVEH